MGLIQFFILCLVVGLVVWLIHAYTPIPPAIKQLILIVAIIVLVLVLLSAMGILGGFDVPIPRVR